VDFRKEVGGLGGALAAQFATVDLVGCPAAKDYNGNFFRELI